MEWILSKNFKSHENIANYYIQKTRENSAELEAVNQAVKKYNQRLAMQGRTGGSGYYPAKKGGGHSSVVCKSLSAAGAFIPSYRAVFEGQAGCPGGAQAGQDG